MKYKVLTLVLSLILTISNLNISYAGSELFGGSGPVSVSGHGATKLNMRKNFGIRLFFDIRPRGSFQEIGYKPGWPKDTKGSVYLLPSDNNIARAGASPTGELNIWRMSINNSIETGGGFRPYYKTVTPSNSGYNWAAAWLYTSMNITSTKEDSNITNKVNKINSVDNPFELYEMLGAIASSNPEKDVMQGKIVQCSKSNLKVPQQGENELDFNQQLEVANGMSIIAYAATDDEIYAREVWKFYAGNPSSSVEYILIAMPMIDIGFNSEHFFLDFRSAMELIINSGGSIADNWFDYDSLELLNKIQQVTKFQWFNPDINIKFSNNFTLNNQIAGFMFGQKSGGNFYSGTSPLGRIAGYYRENNQSKKYDQQYEKFDGSDLAPLKNQKYGFIVIDGLPKTLPLDVNGIHKLYSIEKEYEVPKGSIVTAKQHIDFRQNKISINNIKEYTKSLLERYNSITFTDITYEPIKLTPSPKDPSPIFEDINSNHSVPINITIRRDSADIDAEIEAMCTNSNLEKVPVTTTTAVFNKMGTYMWDYESKAVLNYTLEGNPSTVLERDKNPSYIDLHTSTAQTIIRVTESIEPPVMEDKELYKWRNSPEAFAEVKEGHYNDNRAEYKAETFEVMAGVPTTETMYINTGSTPIGIEMYVRTYRGMRFNYTWTGIKEVRCLCPCPGHSDGHGGVYFCGGGCVHPEQIVYTIKGHSVGDFTALEQIQIQTPKEAIITPPDVLENSTYTIEAAGIPISFEKSEIYSAMPAENGNLCYSDGKFADTMSTVITCKDPAYSNRYNILSKETHAWAESSDIQAISRTDKVIISIEGKDYILLEGNTYNSYSKTYDHAEASGSGTCDARKAMDKNWKSLMEIYSSSLHDVIGKEGNVINTDDPYAWREYVYSWSNKPTDDFLHYNIAQGKPYFEPVGYIGEPANSMRNSRRDNRAFMFAYEDNIKMNLTSVNGIHEPVNGVIKYPDKKTLDLFKDYSTIFDGHVSPLNANSYGKSSSIEPLPMELFNTIPTRYIKGGPEEDYTNPILIHNPVSVKDSYVMSVEDLIDQRINYEAILAKTYIDYGFKISIPHMRDFIGTETLRSLEDCSDRLGPGYTSAMDTSKWIRTKWVKFDIPIVVMENSEDYKYYDENIWIPLYDDGREQAILNDETIFKFHVPENQPDKAEVKVEIVAEAVNAIDGISKGQGAVSDSPGTPGAGARNDYENIINPTRDKTPTGLEYQAAHLAKTSDKFDVIGRIGNIIVDDSTDPRWSDIFWKPSNKDLIPNVSKIPIIAPDDRALFYSTKSNYYNSDLLTNATSYSLNRWLGLSQYHKVLPQRVPGANIDWGTINNRDIGNLPVGVESNPKLGLQSSAIYLGYPAQWSVQTVGAYGKTNLKIQPHYTFVDSTGKQYNNIGLYVQNSSEYKEMWRTGIDDTYIPAYNFLLARSLGDERAKINDYEKQGEDLTSDKWNPMIKKKVGYPHYIEIGQELMTQMGDKITKGKIDEYESNGTIDLTEVDKDNFKENAQRWHLMAQLPSSTIIRDLNTKNLLNMKDGHIIYSVIITTDAAKTNNSPWDLQTDAGGNYYVPLKPNIAKPPEDIDNNPEDIPERPQDTYTITQDRTGTPIVTFETGLTSADDADLVGTH